MNPLQHPLSPTPLVAVDAEHPWLGLAAFTSENQRFFFGRDAEIAEIYVRVRDNTLTILYGQSGLGKSSLLGAGLLPKLRVEGYRPVQIRLRYEDTDPPLLDQVFDEIDKSGVLGTIRPPSLWEWMHHKETRPEECDTRPPVLVFDQFEEIFTLGQRANRMDETRALFTGLAELIENRTPVDLRSRFQEDRRLSREYDIAHTPARLVITLREDFLSHLEVWKKLLPSLMKNRMALDLLDGPQALEAVVRPGRLEGRNLVDDQVGAAIVRFVAKQDAHVPLEEIGAVPPLLSLVCDELNRLRLAQNLTTITAALVESQSGEILGNFYRESFANLPDSVRHFIEDRLVTEGGHRNPVAMEDALKAFRRAEIPDPVTALDQLIARRIISPEERGGLVWIEITHDVLAPLVVRSRDERLERERAAEAELREMEARKARNRLRFLVSLFSVLTLLAVAGAIYGLISSRDAKRQRDNAALQRDEARYNEGLGWMLRAQVAEDRKNQYPDTILYAAQAIGFEGVGRPPDAPNSLLRFIRQDRNPHAYQTARKWIADRPAYLPVWSSAPYPAVTTGLDVSADGRHLAIATADGAVRLWDLRENTMREIVKPNEQAGNLAFDPTGKLVAVVENKEVCLYEVDGGKFSGFIEDTRIVAFSPEGDIIATAGKDGSLRLWQDRKVEVIESGMREAATTITFSADNSRAAAAFSSGIRVFFPHYSALAHAWTSHQEKSSALAFSPDGCRLAAGTPNGEVLLYDAASAAVQGRCSGEQRHGGAVLDLAFGPDGRLLASASADGSVRLWNLSGNIPTVAATLRGHTGGVSKLAWFPGGSLLATAGADGSVRIWDTRGVPIPELDLHHYLAASWYRFATIDREATWSGGVGTANVPADSLLGLHRSKADATPALLAAGAWNGLPSNTPVPPSLVALADAAAKDGRWREVKLRLGQIGRLKVPSGTAENLLEQMKNLGVTSIPMRNREGIEMIWVKPGTFLMGSPVEEEGSFNVETRHKVTITKGYWLAKTELTQSQWVAVMGNNPSTFVISGLQAPVENISWDEAMDFCRRLTDLERARGSIPPGWEYNLPTEAQWEYACRAGSGEAYSFGGEPKELHKFGNYNEVSGNFVDSDSEYNDGQKFTAPVRKYSPNKWGFHDMHGNVFEWCRDKLDPAKLNYGAGDVIDPIGLVGSYRAFRGGGFYSSSRYCRSASRVAQPSSTRSYDLGIRLALVPLGKLSENKQF